MAILSNLRHAIRTLRHNPAFTLVAIGSLTLGIGANTAIFSVIDALNLRRLPVKDPQELVMLGDAMAVGLTDGVPNDSTRLFSLEFAKLLAARTTTLTGVASLSSMLVDGHVKYSSSDAFEAARLYLVSGNYFNVLGINATVGRLLDASDDINSGGHPVAVISNGLWDRRFNRDRGIIGRTMTLNGTIFTIIGVAPPGFQGITIDDAADLWIPLAELKQVQGWLDTKDRLTQFLHVFGRLQPGVSMEQAESNTNVIFQQWVRDIASTRPTRDISKARVELTPLSGGISYARVGYRDPLTLLSGVAGVVLLIACANLANLSLARATGRRREVALRLALGASRARIIFELMSESWLLSIAGGALGIIAGWWGAQFLIGMASDPRHPLAVDMNPNWHVLAFAAVSSLLTCVLFGIVPALRATRVDPGPTLKEGRGTLSSTRSLLSRSLVVAQVTMALLLTVGAGLLIRTLLKVQSVDPGFRTSGNYLVSLDDASSPHEPKAYAELCRQIQQRVADLPGVESVTFSQMNFGGGRWVSRVRASENPDPTAVFSDGNRVDNAYFGVMNMPILAGRGFTTADRPKTEPVAVVNEELAKKLYPQGNALGQIMKMGERGSEAYRIVGIVKMAHYSNLREKPAAMFYLSSTQTEEYGGLVVRSHSTAIFERIRGVIHELDPNLAVSSIEPMQDLVDRTLRQDRLLARLAGFLGAMALLLAAIGLYGILAYSVSQRTNEIGVRMALGAQPGTVQRMILKESMLLVGIGMAAGIPIALACGRWIQSVLYGLEPSDIPTMTAASVVLLMVALGASLLPARRAAKLDPLAALRNE